VFPYKLAVELATQNILLSVSVPAISEVSMINFAFLLFAVLASGIHKPVRQMLRLAAVAVWLSLRFNCATKMRWLIVIMTLSPPLAETPRTSRYRNVEFDVQRPSRTHPTQQRNIAVLGNQCGSVCKKFAGPDV
jgi:hypothetical protein